MIPRGVGEELLLALVIEPRQRFGHALPPKVSQKLSPTQPGQPAGVCELCWKAQNRLHCRFTPFLGRRMRRNKATVAVAREVAGFIWEALKD